MRLTREQALALGVDASRLPPKRSAGRRAPPRGYVDPLLPQRLLFEACAQRWPARVSAEHRPCAERRFRIDVAFVPERLAVELDGWQYHGRFLEDFRRDRERQNVLTLLGWRFLRFTASQVKQDLASCLDQIDQALQAGVASSAEV